MYGIALNMYQMVYRTCKFTYSFYGMLNGH